MFIDINRERGYKQRDRERERERERGYRQRDRQREREREHKVCVRGETVILAEGFQMN